MTPATFYGRMATLMVSNPPSTADKPVVDQMARIGLTAGTPFDWNGLNTTMQDAVTQGAERRTRPGQRCRSEPSGRSHHTRLGL